MAVFKITFALICLMTIALFPSSFAQNSIKVYLDAHNAGRTQVGVGPMKWDNHLATYAFNYANKQKHNCPKLFSLALICIMSLALFPSSFAQNSMKDYLDAHNAARAQVNAGPMTWYNWLEAYALDYANKHKGRCPNLVHSGGPMAKT
ncbi:hypothetical protein M9H77_20564 [Catharanthus roseus]|uniref:Uncharacterized protein n=1 Tax=Catharanthus roseus TaxID=4058 RepID=A0ACC0AKJ4_CATRO|nr:hypothetical protein M9H77_20564 [Catharanthus roseus]